MSLKVKCPDSVRQHATGAEGETAMQASLQSQTYATCGELQTRHLRNRCGLSHGRARLIAAICFGEVR